MPKSTKNSRKSSSARSAKTSARSSKKSNGVVFGRLVPKRRGHWALLLVVVLLVGALGSYFIYSSHATTTALSPSQCKIRGRVGDFSDVTGKYTCYSACRSYAGAWVYNPNGYGYCSHAISTSIGQAKCGSLGRVYVGAVGCARHWMEDAYPGKNVFDNALQCARDGADYHVTNTYDYCSTGSAPSGGIIVGSAPAVGGPNWPGVTDCVAFIKWVLNNHSGRYDGRATGNGGQVAANLRAAFGYKNIRAPHSVVSMPNGSGSWSPGHVALVDTVHADGSIVVEESNWNGHWDQRSISAGAASNMSYAYISDWE